MRIFFSFFCLSLAALMTFPIRAEAVSKPISVEISKGQLIRLSEPASTVAIANPDIADAQVLSPKMLYISGKKVGETSILAIGAKDSVVLEGTVSVTHNLTMLQQSIDQAMPGEHVQLTSADGALVVQGNVTSPYQSARVQQMATAMLGAQQNVVNLLNVKEGDQVMLKVKVAEVSRSALKNFGINIQSLLSTGNFQFGLGNGRTFLSTDPTTGKNVISRSSTNDGALYVGYHSSSGDANSLIDALETDGLLTVLAEPNLTTKSGQPANFLAGGEYPIPVAQSSGTGGAPTITIDYKQFGVSLDFTPTVLSAKKISLQVKPEVSTLSTANSVAANGFNIPSLLTRRASTTVELGSGESFAIAGLLRRDDTNDISKFPGLGDIPIIGALFRSTTFQTDQSELVIIVTPYIVKGVSDVTQIAAPTDGYRPASDLDRILMGKLYDERQPGELTSPNPPATSDYNPALHGPAGFILR